MKFLNHHSVVLAAAALFVTKASATFGDVYATVGSGEEEGDNFVSGTVSFDDDEYVQYPFSSEGGRTVSSVEEDFFGDGDAFTKILSDFQTRLEEGGESLEDMLGSIDMEKIRSLFEEHRVRGDEL